jgi:hypothetical protein
MQLPKRCRPLEYARPFIYSFGKPYQIFGWEKSGFGPSGVQDGGGVTLGQDEPVIGGVLWVMDVVPRIKCYKTLILCHLGVSK